LNRILHRSNYPAIELKRSIQSWPKIWPTQAHRLGLHFTGLIAC
jgi:hypothetical protein